MTNDAPVASPAQVHAAYSPAAPLPRRKWYARLPMYLLGLFLSGFVALWIRAQVEKPAITIQITSLTARPTNHEQVLSDRFDAMALGNAQSGRVRANPELKLLTADHSWIGSPNEDSQVEYLQSLLNIRDSATALLDAMIALRQDFGNWPSSYEGTNLDLTYRLIRTHSDVICGQVFGETRRGADIFSGPQPNLETVARRFDIQTDDDGDHYVDIEKMRIPIIWSTRVRSTSDRVRLKSTAERMANAIAYGVTSDLQALRACAARIFQEEGSTRDILDLVERELQANAHWYVMVTISNNGKDTVALDPRGVLYLQTKDRRYVDANGKEHRHEKNQRLRLTAVGQSKRQIGSIAASMEIAAMRPTNSPVLVRGGEAVTITFRSLEPIGHTPAGEQLLSLFKGDGCPCLIALLPLTQSKLDLGDLQPIRSNEQTFREVEFDTIFPEDIGHWSTPG